MVSAENVLKFQFTMESIVYIKNPILNEDVLRQKYLVERLSIRQIAGELVSSKATISKYLHRYGIKVKKRGTKELAPPNPAYGERRYGNRVVKNHEEQKVISLILNLHEAGYSFRAIARTLNESGVQTRKRSSRWHHWVVAEIVKRNRK